MALLQWKVVAVTHETNEANTYALEPLNGDTISYDAGQFLTFLFTHTGHELRRSYSVSSTPGIDKYISVTVKKKKNGEISRYILKNWHPGTIVISIAPAGRFTIDTDNNQQREFFFVAAGSGITPVYSLLKKVLQFEPLSTVVLLLQNHDERSIIFHQQLLQLEKQYPGRLKRIDLLSKPTHHHIPPQHLNNTLLEKLIIEHRNASFVDTFFYTCGPDLFMRMVQFTIMLMGFEEEQFRKEIFTIDKLPSPSFTLEPVARRLVIHYGKETYSFTTSYPETILQTALNNHVALPYSCKAGQCSTCVAKCLSGSVIMSRNEVLTEEDLQSGLVLTCVGYAETDIILSLTLNAERLMLNPER